MRILVACEFTGTVRDAFAAQGHDAFSCDLRPSETKGNHILGDVKEVILSKWDTIIAHPPCTDLAVSGARWFDEKLGDGRQAVAIAFFMWFVKYQEKTGVRMCIENPVGIMSTVFRKPDQYVQPWMFGDYETKKTGLWLFGLPKLTPEYKTAEECRIALGLPEGTKPAARVWKMPPGPDREKERSRFFPGVARAMASQWGKL